MTFSVLKLRFKLQRFAGPGEEMQQQTGRMGEERHGRTRLLVHTGDLGTCAEAGGGPQLVEIVGSVKLADHWYDQMR